MSDQPLVTLFVTCHNQSEVIAKAIAGALAQDYACLEVLISDDASTDDSISVIERAVADYRGPHCVVVNRNEHNLGIAGHYDRANEIAAGELIVCADGDDVSLPDRVSRFADAWIRSGKRALLLHGPCMMLDEHGMEKGVVSPPEASHRTPHPIRMIDDYLYVIGANFGWTKQLYRHFGPMSRHALIDDHVLPFRAALLGEFAYIDEPLVRKYPGGMADLAVAKTGYDRLFGLFLKELPWKIGDYRQFEADLQKVDRPDRAILLRAACARRALHEMQYRMATASFSGRLARLPVEMIRAVRRRNRTWFKSALLYAGAPITTWLLDVRSRRRAAAKAHFTP